MLLFGVEKSLTRCLLLTKCHSHLREVVPGVPCKLIMEKAFNHANWDSSSTCLGEAALGQGSVHG